MVNFNLFLILIIIFLSLLTDCVPDSLSGVDVSENVDVDWRSLFAELGRINGVNVVFSLLTEFGRAIRALLPPTALPPLLIIACDELLDRSSSNSYPPLSLAQAVDECLRCSFSTGTECCRLNVVEFAVGMDRLCC